MPCTVAYSVATCMDKVRGIAFKSLICGMYRLNGHDKRRPITTETSYSPDTSNVDPRILATLHISIIWGKDHPPPMKSCVLSS